jgi:hypothetical protein
MFDVGCSVFSPSAFAYPSGGPNGYLHQGGLIEAVAISGGANCGWSAAFSPLAWMGRATLKQRERRAPATVFLKPL